MISIDYPILDDIILVVVLHQFVLDHFFVLSAVLAHAEGTT